MIFSLSRLHLMIAFGLLSIIQPWSASAEERWALLIGNQNYAALPSLRNPVNDVRNFAERLARL